VTKTQSVGTFFMEVWRGFALHTVTRNRFCFLFVIFSVFIAVFVNSDEAERRIKSKSTQRYEKTKDIYVRLLH
jgi:hypothetical protein